MTRDRIEIAIQEGIPFEIRMADGRQYKVAEQYKIALGKTHVVVLDKLDMPHVLPLLTMTGISYLKPSKNGKNGKGH
jgi:ribosomal protein L21